MPSQVSSILSRSRKRPGDSLNILTFPTHERVQGMMMGLLPHHFYCWGGQNIKDWNKAYGDIPANHTILDKNKGENQLPMDLDFDCVLSQSRHVHFGIAKVISEKLQIPLVTYEHCIPHPSWTSKYIDALKPNIGHINVYITDYSIGAWGFEPSDSHVSIYHAINTEVFQPLDTIKITPVLTVCNDMPGRPAEVGWEIWQRINQMSEIKPKLVGDNRGFSKAPSSLKELILEYQMSKLFLNTTISSTIPTAMLEAMACGSVPITMKTGAIGEFIKHGVNGLIYKTPEEATNFIKDVVNQEGLLKFMSKNARKTVVDNFKPETYVEKWNKVLERVVSII